MRIEALWWELDVRSQKLNEGVERAEKRLSKFAQFVKAHPVAMLGALGAAFALTGAAAAKFAEQIDRSLRRVDALLPKTSTGVDRLREQLVQLARETPVPLEALSEGLETVVKMGAKNPDAAFSQLAASAKLAQIAGVDLRDAIAGLDQILDSFNLGAGDTGKVLDALAVAAQRGAPLQELAPVLGQVGAQAHAAGISLAEIVAAIGTLTESGVPARQAVAAIREAFGVVDGAAATMGQTQASLGVQLQVVGGQLRFTGQAAAEYNRTLVEMTGASGQADAMIGKLTGSLTDQSEIVRNQLKVAWLQLGEAALPVATKLSQVLAEAFEFWGGTAAENVLTGRLRELATGWRMVNNAAVDSARQGRISAVGMKTVGHALGELAEFFRVAGVDLTQFRRSLAKMPEGELRSLSNALVNLTADQREQLGVTQQQLNQFVITVGQTQLALQRAREASGGSTTPKGPRPLTAEQLQLQTRLRQEAAAQLANLTSSLVDDLEVRLNELLANVGKLPEHVRGEFAGAIARLRAEISGARPLEQLERDLAAIEQRVNSVSDAFGEIPVTLALEVLPSIQELIAQLQTARDKTERGSTLWSVYNDRLKKAIELSAKIAQNIGKAGAGQQDLNAELDKTLDKLELQASRIQSAVRGALQLGEAFGLLDDNAARMLESITQIATEIPKVAAVLKAGGGLEKALPGLLGIAGGVASLIGGLFGGSDPEAERRKEILRENTDAIRKLTERIGEFGLIETTGSQFTQVQDLLARLQEKTGFLSGNAGVFRNLRNVTELQRLETTMGISAQELRAFAEALGITFANLQPTIQELRQLNEALANTELTRFAQTFAGQMELLSRQFQLFDISDPIEQLQRLREVALGFGESPLVETLFGGLDLTTAAGRAALEQRIQDIYHQLQAGTLSPQLFGGLTPQQLLDLLSQLKSTMDQVAEGAEQGRTSQFQVSREVTEVTAGRLVSLLTTSMIWQQETAENTRLIAAILESFRGLNAGLTPPSAAALAAYAAAGLTVNGGINIQVTVSGASPADAQRIGDDVGRAAAAAFDRELGSKLRHRALLQGSVTRN
jgi:hypothetical protein